MGHPDDERLVALALGELDDSAHAHVEDCRACAAQVAELRALLDEIPDSELHEPPPRVWEAVLAEIGRDVAVREAPNAQASQDQTGQDQTGQDQTGQPRDAAAPIPFQRPGVERRDRNPWWTIAAAASVAAVLGVGAGLLVDGDDEPSDPPSRERLVAVPLRTLDGSEQLGDAEVLDVAGVPELHVRTTAGETDGYREVWLIHGDGVKMVSVGLMPSGDQDVTFVVPERLLDEGYRVVDISEEPYDGDPTHSGDSLARGELPELPA